MSIFFSILLSVWQVIWFIFEILMVIVFCRILYLICTCPRKRKMFFKAMSGREAVDESLKEYDKSQALIQRLQTENEILKEQVQIKGEEGVVKNEQLNMLEKHTQIDPETLSVHTKASTAKLAELFQAFSKTENRMEAAQEIYESSISKINANGKINKGGASK